MTRSLTLIPVFLLLGACGGGGDDDKTGSGTNTPTDTVTGDDDDDVVGDDDDDVVGDDDDDDDDDDDGGCNNDVEATFPADGETDAFFRTEVAVNLEDADPSATLAVDGVTGTSEVSNNVVSFTADAPYTAGSTYTATLTYECGTETFAFTVGGVGAPTTVSPNGKVYSLDLTSGTFVVPGASAGDLVADLVDGVEVLFGVTAEPTTEIPMIGALGDGNGAQDVCTPTLDFPVTPTYEDPYFNLYSETLTLSIAGVTAVLDDLELYGAFTEQADAIEGGTLKGSIDTRGLKEALDLPTTAPDEAVCTVVGAVGVACEACADGSGDYCLNLWVSDLTAPEVAGGSIVPISEKEAAANCP